MEHDLQDKADELIRTLGALGLAQERAPHSREVEALMHHAEQLHDSIALSGPES